MNSFSYSKQNIKKNRKIYTTRRAQMPSKPHIHVESEITRDKCVNNRNEMKKKIIKKKLY